MSKYCKGCHKKKVLINKLEYFIGETLHTMATIAVYQDAINGLKVAYGMIRDNKRGNNE